MKKLITIVGARPQFVKAAVVSREISNNCSSIKEVIIHTGQHFDNNMSEVFFEELKIPKPNYNLEVGGGTHGQNTGRMIEKIEEVLLMEKPECILVYGDTDSTLAGAIAAVKLHIPIAHVEAGLRSFNNYMPEEINRIITDRISEILFTPSNFATQNLINEGISVDKIHQVGDIMYDAAKYYSSIYDYEDILENKFNLTQQNYHLATIHRAENVDNKNIISEIIKGFAKSNQKIVWPIHPRTKKRVEEYGIELPSNIIVFPPLGYLDMILLEKNAKSIITDSGGVQKEAFFHGVPCITIRNETEWIELVELGVNKLINVDADVIASAIINFCPTFVTSNIYGDGNTSKKIVHLINNIL
jgi:UDP-GlcNAc3NAcA epimerase